MAMQSRKSVVPSSKKQNGKTDIPAPNGFVFTVGDGETVGAYKVDDKLSSVRLIADFIRQHVKALSDDDSKIAAINKATDDQVVSVFVGADVSDIGQEETELGRRLGAVMDAEFMVRSGETEVLPQSVLPMQGTNLSLARKYGSAVSDKLTADLTKGIEAEKDKDAAPIVVMLDLENEFGKAMEGNQSFFETVPPIGSRYRKGKKGNKAPYGYRLPDDTSAINAKLPVWHGPYDYSVTPVKDPDGTVDDRATHWVAEFTSAKMGKKWADIIDHINALLRDAEKTGCPEWLKALKGNKVKLQAEKDEATFQLNRRINVVGKAFKMIQKRTAIEQRFKHLRVDLVGVNEYEEKPEMAARRRKPFCITTITDLGNGRTREVSSMPVTASRIMNMEPGKYPGNTSSATLLEAKRGKKKNETPKGPADTPEIKDIVAFETTLYSVANYAREKDKLSLVRRRCNDTNDGPAFCSAIIAVYDLLSEIEPEIRATAEKHDQSVRLAQAEADRKEVENKKVA